MRTKCFKKVKSHYYCTHRGTETVKVIMEINISINVEQGVPCYVPGLVL